MTTWDDAAAWWDDDPDVRTYAAAAYESLQSVAASAGFDVAGTRACDFGCGTGLLTERLVEVCDRVDAVDSSPEMSAVVRAKAAHHGWDHVLVAEALPPGRVYDLVVCSSVLGFVDDYPAIVAQLVSQLAPSGLFVQWDWELVPDEDDPHGLTRTAIRGALAGAGLASVAVEVAFEITADGQTMSPIVGSGRRPR